MKKGKKVPITHIQLLKNDHVIPPPLLNVELEIDVKIFKWSPEVSKNDALT